MEENEKLKTNTSPAFASNASFSIARRFGYYDALSSRWLNTPPTARLGNSIVARYSVFSLPFATLGRGLLSVRQRRIASQVQRKVTGFSRANPTSYNIEEAQPDYEFEESGYENTQPDFADAIADNEPESRQNSINSSTPLARVREFQTSVQRSLEGLARSRDWSGMAGQDESEIEGEVFNSSDSYHLDMAQASRVPAQEEPFARLPISSNDSRFSTSSSPIPPIQPISVSPIASSLQRFVAPETSAFSTEARPTEVSALIPPIQQATLAESAAITNFPETQKSFERAITKSTADSVSLASSYEPVPELTIPSNQDTGNATPTLSTSETAVSPNRFAQNVSDVTQPSELDNTASGTSVTSGGQLPTLPSAGAIARSYANQENTYYPSESTAPPMVFPRARRVIPSTRQNSLSNPKLMRQLSELASSREWGNMLEFGEAQGIPSREGTAYSPPEIVHYSPRKVDIVSSQAIQAESRTAPSITRSLASGLDANINSANNQLASNPITNSDLQINQGGSYSPDSKQENAATSAFQSQPIEISRSIENTTFARSGNAAGSASASSLSQLPTSFSEAKELETIKEVAQEPETTTAFLTTTLQGQSAIARAIQRAEEVVAEETGINEANSQSGFESPAMVFRSLDTASSVNVTGTENRGNIAPDTDLTSDAQPSIAKNSSLELNKFDEGFAYFQSPSTMPVGAQAIKRFTEERANIAAWAEILPQAINAGFETPSPSVAEISNASTTINRVFVAQDKTGNATNETAAASPAIKNNPAEVAQTVLPAQGLMSSTNSAQRLGELAHTREWGSAFEIEGITSSGSSPSRKSPDMVYPTVAPNVPTIQRSVAATAFPASNSPSTAATLRESGMPIADSVTSAMPSGVPDSTGLEFTQTSISRAIERAIQADEVIAATTATPDLNFITPPLIMRKVGDFTPAAQDFNVTANPDFAESAQAYTPGILALPVSFEAVSPSLGSTFVMRSLPVTDSKYDIEQAYLTDIASMRGTPQHENRSNEGVPSTNMSHLSSVQLPTFQASTSADSGRKAQRESSLMESSFTSGSGLFRSTLLPAVSSIDNTTQPVRIERMIMRHLNVANTSTESASADKDELNYPARNVIDQHADIERTVLRHISLANASQVGGTQSEWAYASSQPVHLRPEPVTRSVETAAVSYGIQRVTDGISSENNASPHSSQLGGSSQPQAEVDIEKITAEIYRKLKRDMQIERERLGLRSGLMR
ncbi:hypothetical protein [Candidatus Chlorohelix sp.]|uniref:hypothetical protein n=1 Tax=Candidatus Chlorohelix sp. TaxID=3139201 RepID=UPI00305C3A7B